MDFRSIVLDGCAAWGIETSPEAVARMEAFAGLLIEKNRVMNLTAVTEPEEIARRHMLDCVFLRKCGVEVGKRILDIGCGAGFPTMPLLCHEPRLNITSLDSTAKRIKFIQDSCDTLGLQVNAVAARAEEFIAKPGMREGFDVVTSRAVAPLNVLAELCLPYVKQGGYFLPLKSVNEAAEDEIAAARKAIAVLGGKLEKCEQYQIDGMDHPHQVLIIRKVAATPKQYPRRFAKISSSPL